MTRADDVDQAFPGPAYRVEADGQGLLRLGHHANGKQQGPSALATDLPRHVADLANPGGHGRDVRLFFAGAEVHRKPLKIKVEAVDRIALAALAELGEPELPHLGKGVVQTARQPVECRVQGEGQ